MTRDEKIKDIMKYLKFNPYVEGQQRADIEDMLEQMHEWTKEQTIEEACEWLKANADEWIASYSNIFIDNFKKAMEE